MGGDRRPLRIGGVPEHFNLPWHLALESGALDDLAPVWRDTLGGTGEILSGLEDGSLDLASVLTEGSVAAINDGLEATIIQVYVSSPLQWGVFVPAGSGLTDEAELAGRPIAISRPRSGSHLMAYVQAKQNGWNLAEEQFVVCGGLEGARLAFAEGRAEVFLWDQFMTRPLVDAGEMRQVATLLTPWPSFVFAAANDALLGRTVEVGRIVEAVVGEAIALHDRPGLVDLVSSRYGLDTATVEGWLVATTFAERQPWDPTIGRDALATLRAAGF